MLPGYTLLIVSNNQAAASRVEALGLNTSPRVRALRFEQTPQLKARKPVPLAPIDDGVALHWSQLLCPGLF